MADLRTYKPPQMRRDVVLQGRYVRLEPMEPARHAAVLHDAYSVDDTIWQFLPTGPFASSASFHRWMVEATSDPVLWFYAIRDQGLGKWVGHGSYLRDAPASGTIEIGWLCFSPALQRTRA